MGSKFPALLADIHDLSSTVVHFLPSFVSLYIILPAKNIVVRICL